MKYKMVFCEGLDIERITNSFEETFEADCDSLAVVELIKKPKREDVCIFLISENETEPFCLYGTKLFYDKDEFLPLWEELIS